MHAKLHSSTKFTIGIIIVSYTYNSIDDNIFMFFYLDNSTSITPTPTLPPSSTSEIYEFNTCK